MKWLREFDNKLYTKLNSNLNPKTILRNKKIIIQNVLNYFFKSTRNDNLPNDPVSRFHLGNGAVLEKINFLGNSTPKSLNESLGIMANYLYDLNNVEKNHEKYVIDKKINASKPLLKDFSKINK